MLQFADAPKPVSIPETFKSNFEARRFTAPIPNKNTEVRETGMVWFFVDGDDGFGSEDHMLRVKFLRDGVQLEVDLHSKDDLHPLRQNGGEKGIEIDNVHV